MAAAPPAPAQTGICGQTLVSDRANPRSAADRGFARESANIFESDVPAFYESRY